ncbi:periplasmic chaperone for outer membrane proteins SurA [Nonlabens sp. Hel1_33_55]|uniref:peptidylprolyl isomerase n=1 Tax=Nonlabens sp. Hel1_33_55 TaxID=1336802 RepID=UPI000875CF99|nr:peptidylprolyl isomerase [Nonlabens sp. Hel1_33_55]SCY20564.1 periplasmic chaperone for outer membrane proteins SurA [Nonlabens sp. Hel1_33_55]
MMQFKAIDSRLIRSWISVLLVFAFAKAGSAQTTTTPDVQKDEAIKQEVLAALNDTVKPTKIRRKIDGVSGVIGDYVVLDSDIEQEIMALKRENQMGDLTKCDIMESLLGSKLYAHHAIQDSITVSDAEIESQTSQRIEYFKSRLNNASDEELAAYYRKDNIQQLRDELNVINRDQLLASRMQERLTEDVQITPEEVRQFFYSIPEDKRPFINSEVEIARIVVNSKPSEESIQETIEKLNEYRNDVLNNGANFAAKATLYSEDIGTERQGGVLSMRRSDPYAKEFKEAAFSLNEGEISEPFETSFGWHILYVEKVRGQIRDVRHILLYPYISRSQEAKAKAKLDAMRDMIVQGDTTFADAARAISDEKETAEKGGQFVNPVTGENLLDLAKIAPRYISSSIVSSVQFLQEGDVSGIIEEKDPRGTGSTSFTIVNLIRKVKDHEADYSSDYGKIKDLALRDKQVKKIEKWREDKIKDTYIKIGDDFDDCELLIEWNK